MNPLEALRAVDALLAAREIILSLAARHSLHATFSPEVDPNAAGTGSHVHVSMTPPEKHKTFLAGILKYLPAIVAFTYSNDVSYESYGQRMVRRYAVFQPRSKTRSLTNVPIDTWTA